MKRLKQYWDGSDECGDKPVVTLPKPRRNKEHKACITTGVEMKGLKQYCWEGSENKPVVTLPKPRRNKEQKACITTGFEMKGLKQYWEGSEKCEHVNIENKPVVTLPKPRRSKEQKACITTGFSLGTNIREERLKGKCNVLVKRSDLNVELDKENHTENERDGEFEVGRLKQCCKNKIKCEDGNNQRNGVAATLPKPRRNTEQQKANNTTGFARDTELQEVTLKGKSDLPIIRRELNTKLATKLNDAGSIEKENVSAKSNVSIEAVRFPNSSRIAVIRSDLNVELDKENHTENERNSEFEVCRLKQCCKSKIKCEDGNNQRNGAAATLRKPRRNTEQQKVNNTTGFARDTELQEVILKGKSDLPIIRRELNTKLATKLNDAGSIEKENGSAKSGSKYKMETAKASDTDFHTFEAGNYCNIKAKESCQQPDRRDIDIEVSMSSLSENISRYVPTDESVMADTIPAITEMNKAPTWYGHLSVGTVVTAALTTGLAVAGMYFVNDTSFLPPPPEPTILEHILDTAKTFLVEPLSHFFNL